MSFFIKDSKNNIQQIFHMSKENMCNDFSKYDKSTFISLWKNELNRASIAIELDQMSYAKAQIAFAESVKDWPNLSDEEYEAYKKSCLPPNCKQVIPAEEVPSICDHFFVQCAVDFNPDKSLKIDMNKAKKLVQDIIHKEMEDIQKRKIFLLTMYDEANSQVVDINSKIKECADRANKLDKMVVNGFDNNDQLKEMHKLSRSVIQL